MPLHPPAPASPPPAPEGDGRGPSAPSTPSPPSASGANGPALLVRLAALSAQPGLAEASQERISPLLNKLSGLAQVPPERWLALAQALHVGWLKGRPEADPAAHQALLDVLALAWPGTPLAQRLSAPAFTAGLHAEAALGRTDTLAALCGEQPQLLLNPSHTPLLRLCLRLLRRQRAAALMPPLLAELAPAWQPQCAWRVELAQALAMLAQQASEPAQLSLAAEWLPRLLPLIGDSELSEERVPLLSALATLAVRTVNLSALRQLAQALVAEAPAERLESSLNSVLACLAHFEQDDDVAALLDRAVGWLPRSPALHLERARWAFARGADETTLVATLADVDETHPGYRRAMLWMANTLFYQGSPELAESFYQRADQAEPLTGADRARLGHLQVRTAPTPTSGDSASPDTQASARASTPSDSTSATAPTFASPSAPTSDAPAASPASPAASTPADTLDLGEFEAALPDLPRLAFTEPWHDGPSLAELQQLSAQALERSRAGLATLPAVKLDDTVQLVRQLWQLAQQRFQHLAESWPAFPLPWSAAYGRLDPQRGQVMFHALLAQLVAVVEHSLLQPAPFSRHDGGLRGWLELLRFGCDAQLLQGQLGAAQQLLERATAPLGPLLGQGVRAVLQERLALASGQWAQAHAARQSLVVDRDAQQLPMRPWADWMQAQGLSLQGLIDDPAVSGSFESVTADGQLHRHAHATVPVQLALAPVHGLQVRLSFAVQAEPAGLLLPHPWHLTMGDYPYPHADVLNRAATACTLRRPAARRRVAEPVLVLANMDAIVHRNFYHWMLLILPRVLWAWQSGLLAQRRLLLPAELSGWMRSSLDDIGLPADRVLSHGREETLELDDALLMSPLEFAGPSLVEALRCQLWRVAGLDPAQPPAAHRLLFVTRRSENRRPLVSEPAIIEAALARGYEVVAPETLSLLDQVRLFASARAIAGPPGAAFTNLLWAQAGSRVLSLFKADVNLPTFVDLSLLRGQPHRWLLGHNLPGFERASTLNAPYDVPLPLAEASLDWAAGA